MNGFVRRIRSWKLSPLLWVTLVVGSPGIGVVRPVAAVPLVLIELVQEENEQFIRIRGQGPLPYQLLEKTESKLVLFVPHGELGNVPPYVSYSPLADISLEANPVGVRLSLENLSQPVRITSGTRPGVIEIHFVAPPSTETEAPLGAIVPGLTETKAPPGSPVPATAGAPQTGQQTQAPAAPGSISDTAEEDPDPAGEGIAPVPSRPTPPPP